MLLQPGSVKHYAFKATGTWLIQLALEMLDRSVAVQLASDLKGSVVSAIKSNHANHVIQKIVRILRPDEAPFIIEEIQSRALDLACHPQVCRVVTRLLEYAMRDPSLASLMDGSLANAKRLIKDAHSRYVVESALVHGLSSQRRHILSELHKNFMEHVKTCNGQYVLQKLLQEGEHIQREAFASQFLALSDKDLGAVARSYYGSFIVQAVSEVSADHAQCLQQRFEAPSLQWRLQCGKAGKRLRGILGSDAWKRGEQ